MREVGSNMKGAYTRWGLLNLPLLETARLGPDVSPRQGTCADLTLRLLFNAHKVALWVN